MKKTIREQLEAAEAEAAKHGASVTLRLSMPHNKLIVTLGSQRRMISVSGSPRSGVENACNMTRQEVARAIRQMQG
jgi:hypothetical protein